MALRVVRNVDLVLLVLALALFLAADLPLLGWATATGAWLVQRGVKELLERRAAASDDPKTVAGLMAGSMIARGWLVALAVFGAGLTDEDAGLSAAVLFLFVFTVFFTTQLIARPFGERPGGGPAA